MINIRSVLLHILYLNGSHLFVELINRITFVLWVFSVQTINTFLVILLSVILTNLNNFNIVIEKVASNPRIYLCTVALLPLCTPLIWDIQYICSCISVPISINISSAYNIIHIISLLISKLTPAFFSLSTKSMMKLIHNILTYCCIQYQKYCVMKRQRYVLFL